MASQGFPLSLNCSQPSSLIFESWIPFGHVWNGEKKRFQVSLQVQVEHLLQEGTQVYALPSGTRLLAHGPKTELDTRTVTHPDSLDESLVHTLVRPVQQSDSIRRVERDRAEMPSPWPALS